MASIEIDAVNRTEDHVRGNIARSAGRCSVNVCLVNTCRAAVNRRSFPGSALRCCARSSGSLEVCVDIVECGVNLAGCRERCGAGRPGEPAPVRLLIVEAVPVTARNVAPRPPVHANGTSVLPCQRTGHSARATRANMYAGGRATRHRNRLAPSPARWRIVAAVADPVPEYLRDHPDRLRWNAWYGDAPLPAFDSHLLVDAAIRTGLTEGRCWSWPAGDPAAR
jgi:hypothetical protein